MQLDINIVCTSLIRLGRLVYDWVMVDQELSLFHDTTPVLSISELMAHLPSPEHLWAIDNAQAWLDAMRSLYQNVNPQLLSTLSLTPSLRSLFQDFLEDHLSKKRGGPTPQQLRLLLHPIQAMLCNARQILSCFSDALNTRSDDFPALTKQSTFGHLNEVRSLLRKWHNLNKLHDQQPDSEISRTNLVLYHLMSMSAVTNFPEIERLARREGHDGTYLALIVLHKHCIYHREEAIFHSGQVFRLVRSMPWNRRPSWWAAAIYRATLVLFADCVSRKDPNFPKCDDVMHGNLPVAVDQLTLEDPAAQAYLWQGQGVPVLTRTDGNGSVDLESPSEVLGHAIKTLEEGAILGIVDGIKRKLKALGTYWQIQGFFAPGHV